MANGIILMLLSMAYAVLCICCVVEFQRRAADKTKLVCLSKVLFWIGAITGAVFLLIGWFAADQDGSVAITIEFGAFALGSMASMLAWKNCYIVYDKNGFTQKNFIGMYRSFTYDQVSAELDNSSNPMVCVLYAAGKKISFNLMSDNGADFYVTVNAGYRRTHGKKNMPEIRRNYGKEGGFRAHVHNPGEFLAIFIMLVVFVVGLGLFIVISDLKPVDENDGQEYSVTFSDWQIDDQSVVLTSPQMQEPFIIGGYQQYLTGFDCMTEKCDGKTVFSVCAERITPDNGAPYYWVYALSSEGEVFRTFEDSTAYKRQDFPISIAFFVGILAVVLAMAAFVYAVGSNPQKFPKWVVYCCFKKDAIDI